MSIKRETDDDSPGFRAHMETRLDTVERELGNFRIQSEKGFSDINSELRKLSAKLAESPQYRVGEVLDVITKSAGLLALCAGAIIWIATSISAGPTAELRAKLDHERERAARIERVIERIADMKVAELRK